MLINANSCDVIGHVLSTNQKVPQILPLSDNRGLYGGASSGNKRTTNQNAPFQISTNQNEPQNLTFWRIEKLLQINVSGAIIGDDTLRPLVTVSLQNGVIYANLC